MNYHHTLNTTGGGESEGRRRRRSIKTTRIPSNSTYNFKKLI